MYNKISKNVLKLPKPQTIKSAMDPSIFQSELDRVISLAPAGIQSQSITACKHDLYSCARRVFAETAEDDLFEGDAASEHTHLLRSIGNVLLNELTLNSCKHCVFYRLVTEKMISYEINTVLLHLLGHTVRESHTSPLNLIPTPSIMEKEYPVSMKALMDMFDTRCIQSDMECAEFMISTNCSLLPTGYDSKYHAEPLFHELEANPARFYYGYDATFVWSFTARETLEKIMGVDPKTARDIVTNISSLYKAQFKENDHVGHLIQISIPETEVERFAYMSVAYGHPVQVIEHTNGRRMAHQLFNQKENPRSRKLTMLEALASPEISKLQARIIAHPNLFLLHGATVSVESAHAGFDRKRFQDEMIKLLEPLATYGMLKLEKYV